MTIRASRHRAGPPGPAPRDRRRIAAAARARRSRCRPVLRLAAAARARRPPGPVRGARRRRAVQPRAGDRLLVDDAARCARARPSRSTDGARASTCSSPPTTSPSRSSSPRSPPPSRLRGAERATSTLLDDGGRPEMAALAERHGARYIARAEHAAPRRATSTTRWSCTDAAVRRGPRLRPRPATSGSSRRRSATWPTSAWRRPDAAVLRQRPRGRHRGGRVGAAGAVLRPDRPRQGRPRRDVLLRHERRVPPRRRWAGRRLPRGSLTEDFELSIHLHEHGWRTAYVPEVLAQGLGPEDMASYVGQQQRWARGCLSASPTALRAELPLACAPVPAVVDVLPHRLDGADLHVDAGRPHPHRRAAAGAAGADQFLAHFAPYFGWSLLTVALVGGGATRSARSRCRPRASGSTCRRRSCTLLGRRGQFVVTPKTASRERQIRAGVAGAGDDRRARRRPRSYGLARRASARRR